MFAPKRKDAKQNGTKAKQTKSRCNTGLENTKGGKQGGAQNQNKKQRQSIKKATKRRLSKRMSMTKQGFLQNLRDSQMLQIDPELNAISEQASLPYSPLPDQTSIVLLKNIRQESLNQVKTQIKLPDQQPKEVQQQQQKQNRSNKENQQIQQQPQQSLFQNTKQDKKRSNSDASRDSDQSNKKRSPFKDVHNTLYQKGMQHLKQKQERIKQEELKAKELARFKAQDLPDFDKVKPKQTKQKKKSMHFKDFNLQTQNRRSSVWRGIKNSGQMKNYEVQYNRQLPSEIKELQKIVETQEIYKQNKFKARNVPNSTYINPQQIAQNAAKQYTTPEPFEFKASAKKRPYEGSFR